VLLFAMLLRNSYIHMNCTCVTFNILHQRPTRDCILKHSYM